MMCLSLYSSLNAQNTNKLEIGINGSDFNFDNVQGSSFTYSTASQRKNRYKFNLFINFDLAKSRSFFHINILKSYNKFNERGEKKENNTILKEFKNDRALNNTIGLYFGLGRNLIPRSKYRLQIISRIGFEHSERRMDHLINYGSDGIEYESIQSWPEIQRISLQTELKFGYNVYKKLYIWAGFVTSLTQNYEGGKYVNKSIIYTSSEGIEVNEESNTLESHFLHFIAFNGFFGLSVKL